MTSHDLLAKWVHERDELAFRELVTLHGPMVFATSKRILGNAADAEDLTQDCFETLALARRQHRGHLGAWLHRVATNRCIDRLRSAQRRAEREKSFNEHRSTPDTTGWSDIYDQVDAAIAALPRAQREPLVAHFLQGRSHVEIANELHLSRQAVTRRIQRGLEGIRKHLARRGVQIPAVTLSALLVQHMNASALSLPPTLAAALGKLALAGHAATKVALVSALGGLSVAKALSALTLAAGVVVATLFASETIYSGRPTPSPVPQISAPTTTRVSDAARVPARPEALSDVDSLTTDSQPASHWPLGPSAMPAPTVLQGKLAEATPAGGSISGNIVRADGKPYANARVQFEPLPSRALSPIPSNEPIPIISCDADLAGSFRKDGLEPGDYSVQAVPPASNTGGQGFELARVTLKKDEHRANLRLVYGGEGILAITGQVTNALGEPFAGMTVNTTGNSLSRSAVTDPSGHFTIEFLPEGQYQLHATNMIPMPMNSRYAYAGFDANAVAWAGDKDVNLIIPRPASIEGRAVRADTGEPITAFKAGAVRGNIPNFHPELTQSLTPFVNPLGIFRLTNLQPGDTLVIVTADSLAPQMLSTSVEDGQTRTDVVVALAPGSALRGRVVDDANRPIPNAEIRLGEVADLGRRLRQDVATHTNAAGEFKLSNLPKNLAAVNASHADFAPAAALPSNGMIITLRKAPILKLAITENGIPLPDARFSVRYPAAARSSYDAHGQTDGNGLALINDVMPGPTIVSAYNPHAKGRELQKVIDLAPGKEHTVAFDFGPATASLEGIVTWQGRPIRPTTVLLWIPVTDGIEEFRAPTTPDGGYWFDSLPPGAAHMRLWSDEYPRTRPDAYRQLTLIPGEKSRLDVTLTGDSRIEGRFLGFEGADQLVAMVCAGHHTLDDATSQMIPGEGAFPPMVRFATADDKGLYTVENLEPGDYTIIAETRPRNDWATRKLIDIAHLHVGAGETASADFTKR